MLRRKTLLAVTITLVALIVVLYVVSQKILLDGFLTLESQIVSRSVSRVENILNDDRKTMMGSLQDWAYWDETYDYMAGTDPGYIDTNISDATFQTFRLNIMMYVDPAGKVVFAQGHDTDEAKGADLVKAVEAMLSPDSPLLADMRLKPGETLPPSPPGHTGVLLTSHGPLLVAVAPILNNLGQGTPHGVLIWGRYLGAGATSRFSALTGLPVTVIPIPAQGAAADPRLAHVQFTPDSSTAVVPVDEHTVAGYDLVDDINGAPAFVFEVLVPRDVYQRGQSTLTYLVISLIVTGVIVGAVMLVLIERLVLARLARLNRGALQIAQQRDFSIRLPDDGTDELSNLGRTINTGLAALSQSEAELRVLNADLEARVAARTAELQARQNYLQTILDTMKEGVVFGGADEIYSVNDVILEMTGCEAEALIGKPYRVLFDDAILAMPGRDADATPARRGEGALRRADGGHVDVSVIVSPTVERDGQSGRITIVRDVTEEHLLQARKDRFLSNASHELRTPITNLMTRLYLLRRQPERLDDHLDILDTVVLQMRTLVEDLLDASRFNPGSPLIERRITALQPLIESVVALQRLEAELKDLSLTVVVPPEPVYASVDPKGITQVLTNLIANAVHYTENGGRVTVGLEAQQQNGAARAVIQVRDNGIGISPENLEQVFQPFFRANQDIPGTGLGLAIVKEIVDQHNGEIAVHSQPGVGSVFTVSLTAAEAPANSAP